MMQMVSVRECDLNRKLFTWHQHENMVVAGTRPRQAMCSPEGMLTDMILISLPKLLVRVGIGTICL